MPFVEEFSTILKLVGVPKLTEHIYL